MSLKIKKKKKINYIKNFQIYIIKYWKVQFYTRIKRYIKMLYNSIILPTK